METAYHIVLSCIVFVVYCLGMLAILQRIDSKRSKSHNNFRTELIGRAWIIGYTAAWIILIVRYFGGQG